MVVTHTSTTTSDAAGWFMAAIKLTWIWLLPSISLSQLEWHQAFKAFCGPHSNAGHAAAAPDEQAKEIINT